MGGDRKTAYLNALTQEIAQPGARHLDGYLKPFLRSSVGVEDLAGHVANARGLNGSALEENRVVGSVADPEVQARYEAQRLQRQRLQERDERSDDQNR